MAKPWPIGTEVRLRASTIVTYPELSRLGTGVVTGHRLLLKPDYYGYYVRFGSSRSSKQPIGEEALKRAKI
jgi:hypothetical protein